MYIKEKNYGKHILTDLFQICIIELPKVKKYSENTDLDTWVNFIKNPEVIDMSDGQPNEAVKNAKKVLEEISKDKKERYLAELRQKNIMDKKAIEDRGIEKGIKLGIEQGIKQGIETGIKQGIETGIKQGIEQGIEQSKINTAKKMIEENCSIELIIKITGLTKEQIENII